MKKLMRTLILKSKISKNKKASENSEALILYFGIEIPIFKIIVDVLQEHSAQTAVHYSMVIRM